MWNIGDHLYLPSFPASAMIIGVVMGKDSGLMLQHVKCILSPVRNGTGSRQIEEAADVILTTSQGTLDSEALDQLGDQEVESYRCF